MKCKFQDNLEFMQWVKRYWDQNFPGGAYDAVHRRKGGAAATMGGAPGKSPAATRAAVGAMSRKPINTTNTAGKRRQSYSKTTELIFFFTCIRS